MITIAAVATAALVLSGCSLLTTAAGLVLGPQARPSAAPAADLEVGACLNGMVGYDSDRESIVSCDGPHRFEVIDIVEWPDMADFVGDDAEAAWDALHSTDEPEQGSPADRYYDWASERCQQPAMQISGLDDVEVDGHTAAELWLHLGGSSGVDLSLASHDAFVAGDHRTVCSAAWYDIDSGSPKIVEFPSGVRFADVNTPQFPSAERECWDEEYAIIDCSENHMAQVIVDFSGLAAFGPDFVTHVAESTATEDEWNAASDFCDELTDEAMARPDLMAGLAYWADSQSDWAWAEWDGTVDPDAQYRFSCVVGAPDIADLLVGDVFQGTAVTVPGAATGSGSGSGQSQA